MRFGVGGEGRVGREGRRRDEPWRTGSGAKGRRERGGKGGGPRAGGGEEANAKTAANAAIAANAAVAAWDGGITRKGAERGCDQGGTEASRRSFSKRRGVVPRPRPRPRHSPPRRRRGWTRATFLRALPVRSSSCCRLLGRGGWWWRSLARCKQISPT